MANLIGRVTSGRIFKEIGEYACGRRGITGQHYLGSQNSTNFKDAEEELTPLQDSIDATNSAVGTVESKSSSQIEHSSVQQDAENNENLSTALLHIQAVNYESALGGNPLTAKYPEVFTFVGKENGVGTGVTVYP
jgi:hypothetical protein